MNARAAQGGLQPRGMHQGLHGVFNFTQALQHKAQRCVSWCICGAPRGRGRGSRYWWGEGKRIPCSTATLTTASKAAGAPAPAGAAAGAAAKGETPGGG